MEKQSGRILKPGMVLDGKWVVEEFLSVGGMGEIYRAKAMEKDFSVALKIVSHEWLKSICLTDHETQNCIERFRREARALARIRHPNVLRILDSGAVSVGLEDGGEIAVEYMAMELTEPSYTLRRTMAQWGFYPNEERLREWIGQYYLPLLDGVGALHALGIVHRDLKPESVLIDEALPRITDFWLARSPGMTALTRTFELKGTLHYMSPEHFADLKRTDERTDIYSLGKILADAVAGKAIEREPPLKAARLPKVETPFFQRIDRVIHTATSESRDERFPSVAALKKALEEALSGKDLNGAAPKARAFASGSSLLVAGALFIMVLLAVLFWRGF